QAPHEIWRRAEVIGIPARRVDGNDVLAIHAAAGEAIDAMRRGGGPRFVECPTYRWREHVGPGEDWTLGYRSEGEAAPWLAADEVPRLAAMLSADERLAIEADAESRLADAFAFAEASPFPPGEELF